MSEKPHEPQQGGGLAEAGLLCESRKRRPRAAAMRYSDWLVIADLGVTFHQYLTDPRFKERRDGCSHNAELRHTKNQPREHDTN